ncbi:hypothetical protein ACS0TY_024147 [Phlomoides rotata]
MARKFSPQVNSAWRLAVVTMIWIIWDQRNKCIFDGAMVSTSRTLAQFWAYMREANDSHLGCMHNDVFDLMVLSTFNIVGRPSKGLPVASHVEAFIEIALGFLEVVLRCIMG